MSTETDELRALAAEVGVGVGYHDAHGAWHEPPPDALAAIVAAVGVPVTGPSDAAEARRVLAAPRARALVEPVTVAWNGRCTIALDVPAHLADADVALATTFEAGTHAEAPVADATPPAPHGDGRVRRHVDPGPLPAGVHEVAVRVGDRAAVTIALSAPDRCFAADEDERLWGITAPLPALRAGRSRPVGDLADLRRLASWAGARGATLVGTLPLLPTYLDGPVDPSPYAPVSRLHWHEALLDLAALPDADPGAAEPAAPVPPRGALVDWPAVHARARAALDAAVARCDADPARAAALDAFLDAHPDVAGYARFRAERLGAGPEVARRHAYGQWCARDQLRRLADDLDSQGRGLYLDLPVGTHPDGWDVAAHPHLFASDAEVGAPPDPFAPDGQRWGLPPVRPGASRADGHAYFRACLAHQMAVGAALRLDHVMGLHRLFWVPAGGSGRDGAYVAQPADELWATVCLESHRHRCRVVGEDLGTVPDETRRALDRHGAMRSWVGQFELDAQHPRPDPPRRSLASLGTHDLVPFAAWWAADDVTMAAALGRASAAAADDACTRRDATGRAIAGALGVAPEPRTVWHELLVTLGAGDARAVVVALEDCWGAREAYNVPGTTGDEHPNWRRRFDRSLEDLDDDPTVDTTLRALDRARRDPTGRRG